LPDTRALPVTSSASPGVVFPTPTALLV